MHGFQPADGDLALAQRALLDTVAVMLAARDDKFERVLDPLSEPGRWTALAHVLDFDDLHLPSTAHISAVCVPAVLSCDGGARAYLAGAGVMARLGDVLGWRHYAAGWHATCTTGAPGAAVAAAVAAGLDAPDEISRAIALAVPGAGGVQRAFGTQAKSLQVAFAVEAGIRAAALVAAGADADPRALDDWVRLVNGGSGKPAVADEAVPGGLALKLYPCCYALQRPIAALRELGSVDASHVQRVKVRTPTSALAPLIHHRPATGLEGKFSLEYGLACALLDDPIRVRSFSDQAVVRPAACRLMDLVEVEESDAGEGLLAGATEIALTLEDGAVLRSSLVSPPGAPDRALGPSDLRQKVEVCVGERVEEVLGLDWNTTPGYLRRGLAA